LSEPFYVTTPIYYVNGLPHIGHAYTTIAADVACRWQRTLGRPVFFLTGTDEHGQKVLQTAESRGMTPQAHVDDLVVHWRDMWEKLDIQYDRFIRTTDADHVRVVQAVLQKLWDEGLIVKRDYVGWYHVGDEIFVTEKDVEAGKYPLEQLQRITESNYWFLMSRFQDALVRHIEENPSFILPESRRNEVRGFLRQPLGDLCISRPKARMSWGIEIPFDSEYVCYVWFDALLNYLSGVGYHPDPNCAGPDWPKWWPASYQLLGKDILTTHSVYWSTMLMAAGVPLPRTLLAHGWWTSTEGEKMSKSKGNAIDIRILVEEFGPDAARYFFLRDKALGADGGFSYQGFLTRYNADLANDLGNLAHRGFSMTTTWLGAVVPANTAPSDLEDGLRAVAVRAVRGFVAAMADLQYHSALESLWELVRAGNKYIDTAAPWALNSKGERDRLGTVLRYVLEVSLLVGSLLAPYMPRKSAELLGKLGWTPAQGQAYVRGLVDAAAEGMIGLDALTPESPIQLGDPLFPRHREMPARIAALYDPEPEPGSKPAKPPKAPPPPKKKAEPPAQITYDDFAKVALRAGKVLSAAPHPSADRLLVLSIDLGEPTPRQIVAGIASKFKPDDLVGRQVVVVANLAPAMLRGVESQGMLLAAGAESVVDLVTVNADPGETVR
jgi:methionyl-tRNA synthetase